MSWGEVKKVNSDLSIPLDERMGYVVGAVPRGVISKCISSTGTGAEVEILNIEGSGGITEMTVTGAVNAATFGGYTANIKVYIDENTSDSKTIIFHGNGNYHGLSTNTVSIDINNVICDVDLSNDAEITTNGSYVINAPIIFKKSLRVVFYGQISGCSTSIKYALF